MTPLVRVLQILSVMRGKGAGKEKGILTRNMSTPALRSHPALLPENTEQRRHLVSLPKPQEARCSWGHRTLCSGNGGAALTSLRCLCRGEGRAQKART